MGKLVMEMRHSLESELVPVGTSLELRPRSRAYSFTGSLVFWCAIAAALGGILAWRYRSFMNPDGISYLDIARNALRDGPTALVNPHWSPLYPALIALCERVHRPAPFGEFAYVHALNAIIYTAAAISFAYFLRELIRFRSSTGRSPKAKALFTAFSFALFFRFMNTDVTAFVVTPDLLVAATAFLAAGLFFRILKGQAGLRVYAGLGAVFAVGYFAKAVLLPAGLVLLGILFLQSPRSRSRRIGVFTALVTMSLLSFPQIFAVSKRVGHLSFSETGRLNYIWWVDGKPFQGWTGTPDEGVPLHGPRVIATDPKIIEFAEPIAGTYPLWYDPAYWFAGAKVRINLRRQLLIIENSLRFYRWNFPDFELPLEGVAVLFIFSYVRRRSIGRDELLLVLWPIIILSMYALLFTAYRYAAPFIVIFWIAVYSSVITRISRVERLWLVLLTAAMLVSSTWAAFAPAHRTIGPNKAKSTVAFIWAAPPPNPSPDQIAARAVIAMGEKPGGEIATVGNAFSDYFAHIARLRVVAEVVSAQGFWALSPNEANAAERKIAGTGATLLVAKNRPGRFQAALWKNIPGTTYSIMKLHD